MTVSRPDLSDLLDRLSAGEPEAARLLVEHYGHHVRRVLRMYLSREARSMWDSADIVQQVWASACRLRLTEEQLQDPEVLLQVLCAIGVNKARLASRQAQAQKRGAGRTQSLARCAEDAETLVDPRPGPAKAAENRDLVAWALRTCSDQQRAVVELWSQGHAHREIAEELGISERTVRREFEDFHRRIQERRKGAGSPTAAEETQP